MMFFVLYLKMKKKMFGFILDLLYIMIIVCVKVNDI